jgi:hypothetical protein
MKEKQVFAILANDKVVATVEAKDEFSAMREFKTYMRNTWYSLNPTTLRVIPVNSNPSQ